MIALALNAGRIAVRFAVVLLAALSLVGELRAQTPDSSGAFTETWRMRVVSFGDVALINEYSDDGNQLRGADGQPIKRIGFKNLGTGVCFYVRLLSDSSVTVPVLVTAKHMFYNFEKGWYPESLYIRHPAFESRSVYEFFGRLVRIRVGDERFWISHPDPSVDLACLPILWDSAQLDGKQLRAVPYKDIATEKDYFEGKNVLVLGYPGLVGPAILKKSVLRHGMISWVAPESPGLHPILVDVNAFGGNSGGPVYEALTYHDRAGNFDPSGSMKFIGIVTKTFRMIDQYSPPGERDTILASNSTRGGFDTLVTNRHIRSINYGGMAVVEPGTRVGELLRFAVSGVDSLYNKAKAAYYERMEKEK